jgi:hypothetical protein
VALATYDLTERPSRRNHPKYLYGKDRLPPAGRPRAPTSGSLPGGPLAPMRVEVYHFVEVPSDHSGGRNAHLGVGRIA